jgi:hypothetical protein
MILQRGSLRTTLRCRLAMLKAARNFLTRLASDKLQAELQASSNKRQAATYTNNKINISTNHE